MDGYGVWWRGHYVASLTTRESSGSQQDLQVNAIGRDSHIHKWLEVPSDLSTAGVRAKSDGTHVTSASSLPSSGHFATLRLNWDESSHKPRVMMAAPRAPGFNGEARAQSTSSREKLELGHSSAASIEADFFAVPTAAASNWSLGTLHKWSDSADWQIGIRVRASAT